jgi:hypothetical protein
MAKQQAAGGKVKEQQKNTLTQESLAHQHSVIHKKKKAGLFKKKFSFSNFLSK